MNRGTIYIKVRWMTNESYITEHNTLCSNQWGYILEVIGYAMMKALRVSLEDVEKVRSLLLEEGLLDKERKIRIIFEEGGKQAEIPVLDNSDAFTFSLDVPFQETDQTDPEFYHKTISLKEELKKDVPAELHPSIPSGWQVIGNVIVITIPENAMVYRDLIVRALCGRYPDCDTILRDRGIAGPLRKPVRELIYGHCTQTLQKENGCLFKLDVALIMYSKGNLAEKKRMSLLGSGEVVVDMFAGIGYFSIPIAVHSHPLKIISIELNPISFGYLQENIKLNKVEGIIEPICGDCGIKTPPGIADRVIMGYVGTTHHYLDQGIRALKPEGGMLHYHETTPEELIFDRPVQRITEAARKGGRSVRIDSFRRIKKYSPGVWHVVVDAFIGPFGIGE